jgi:hypothetical protein
MRQKRPTIEAKETYYRGKRDLLTLTCLPLKMSVEWDVAPFGKEEQDTRRGCGQRRRSDMRSLKTECLEMASLHFCRYLSAL